MVVIGMDAHKRTHTMVAVDELGRRLGERTVAAASDGTCRRCSGRPGGPGERFALEDCRHLTRRLEGDLLRAGFAVVRVHNTWVGSLGTAVSHGAGWRRAGRSACPGR